MYSHSAGADAGLFKGEGGGAHFVLKKVGVGFQKGGREMPPPARAFDDISITVTCMNYRLWENLHIVYHRHNASCESQITKLGQSEQIRSNYFELLSL